MDLIISFPRYLVWRTKQISFFIGAVFGTFLDLFTTIKSRTVSRLFWGRGNWYRSSFHLIIIFLTVGALGTGIASKMLVVEANQEGLVYTSALGATSDLLQQGSSIQTVLAVDPLDPEVKVEVYTVQDNEDLVDVASKFDVSPDTIRWANAALVSPFSNELEKGWKLKIPQMNGVLYTVKEGQTLAEIVDITKGNKFDIIELNGLVPPSYEPIVGQNLFIPEGSLGVTDVIIQGIPMGVFSNPLTHPSCNGYRWVRGFTSYHKGVDLAIWPGCPIRAIATGEVTYAGWLPMAGFTVKIDHGGGIESRYYHGDGTFWVKTGDRVQQGQEIMMMGTTGNSTGVHLHLGLFKNGIPVNPAPFVPY